jgi:hypothetical protein
MLRLPTRLGGWAVALLLAAPATGRADLIHWTYNWSASPTNIKADSPGTGYITLTDEPGKPAAGNSDIVATNLQVHSTATPAKPDVFTNKSYTLGLVLTDQASGASASLAFTGQLNGTATAGSANITNTFTGIGIQSVQLGDNLYIVTIGPYTPPGPPSASNSGSIGAHALIVIHHLPEPASFVLAAAGVSFVALARLRRRAISQGA